MTDTAELESPAESGRVPLVEATGSLAVGGDHRPDRNCDPELKQPQIATALPIRDDYSASSADTSTRLTSLQCPLEIEVTWCSACGYYSKVRAIGCGAHEPDASSPTPLRCRCL